METRLPRKSFLRKMGMGIASVFAIPGLSRAESISRSMETQPLLPPAISDLQPMGFQWDTLDPFLFCVHHEDKFPKGNDQMGPAVSLAGRSLGDDFIIKDGFRMYHGKQVPGFPGHPHRGFETVTVVREGMVDHADSMGAAGRYGNGDVQWMTAGKGVQHSEMFPLIQTDRPNPMELFQIWINLPARRKMADPHFKMFWSDTIPHVVSGGGGQPLTEVELIAGRLGGRTAPAPPPDSWASDPANEVAILNIRMEAGAIWTLPAAAPGLNRMLDYSTGEGLRAAGVSIGRYHSFRAASDRDLKLESGATEARILVLQGRPIGERVVQYGPFVMNTKEEIQQAFEDYHRTQFGGWPWPRTAQVHDRNAGRFALHADGRKETRG